MLRVHGNLAICYDHLQKISRQIGVVRKLSDAPSVYVQAVVETVRRRQFRGQFMKVVEQRLKINFLLFNVLVRTLVASESV